MFGMAGETEFDVRFSIFGIPVRVHPIFWLSSVWLVWGGADGEPRKVIIGLVAIFVSVLVHELGHAFLSRHYGYPSEIVLYILGGYATATRFSTWKNVKVSAAGPAAGLALFGLTYAVLRIFMVQSPDSLVENTDLTFAINMMLFANLTVSFMNLVPVTPLDGGRIVESLMNRYGGRMAAQRTLQIGIIAAGVVVVRGIYCINNPESSLFPLPEAMFPPFLAGGSSYRWLVGSLQPEPRFITLFFGILCASQVATYNEHFGRRQDKR